MQIDAPDFATIIEVLLRHDVDFIIVGGVCAVLLGAPVTTFDLDIVHSRTDENLNRLHCALNELDAHYREHLPKRLNPTIEGLNSKGHHLLATRFGPLDVLGSIGIDDDYDRLVSHINQISINENITAKILQLNTLIEVKEKTAREKDFAMLNVLRTMREMNIA
ncbi:MAG: hypothetical protein OER96_02965 [Gammaproteobacteria bacterium]|nr:hypothetical protein [Gammaproteobacteria bacterium]